MSKIETSVSVQDRKTIETNTPKQVTKPQPTPGPTRDVIQTDSLNSDEDYHDLDLVGLRICQIITPVSLCALYVVVLVKILEQHIYKSPGIISAAWRNLGVKNNGGESFSNVLVGNIIIVGVFLGLIVVVSIVILFVFYMEWHACLAYYFYLPSLIMMTILTPYFIREVLASLNWFGLDMISLVIFTWNFTALGLIAIFGVYAYAPLYIQQFYLIHNSAILAVLILNSLPGWAPWLLLVFLVFWDLFAVLAPCGPLKLLINMAEKEGVVEMPGLIYTTESAPARNDEASVGKAKNEDDDIIGNKSTSDSDSDAGVPSIILPALAQSATIQPTAKEAATKQDTATNLVSKQQVQDPKVARKEQHQDGSITQKETSKKRKSIEERGVNIGLGDFIFYSLFIGLTVRKQKQADYYTAIAALDAILVGVVLTLIILALTRRTLPALPISVGLGLLIAPLTIYFGSPLANKLAFEQVFI